MNQVTINAIIADLEAAMNTKVVSKKAIKAVVANLQRMSETALQETEAPKTLPDAQTLTDNYVFIKNLTALEKRTLTELAGAMYAEWGYSDIGHSDLVELTGIEGRKLRGVICSLVRKGLITIDDRKHHVGYVSNTREWEPIIYLINDAVGLVEHWVTENPEDIKKAIIV